MSTNAELSGNGAADHELNGNGVADMNGNGAAAPEFVVPAYQGTGGQISRFITPGGHPQDTSNPAFPVFHRKFANPSPLGLMSFGGTTVLLSMIYMQWRSVNIPNVVVGCALFYGGFCQIVTGIMEFASGNTFGTCAFTGFGAFWCSWATFFIPWFGTAQAYADHPSMFLDAIGLWCFMWSLVVLLLAIALLRASIALLSVFLIIAVVLILLGVGNFVITRHHTIGDNLHKAAGAFGLIGGLLAMYIAMAGLLTPDTSYFTIPVGDLSPK